MQSFIEAAVRARTVQSSEKEERQAFEVGLSTNRTSECNPFAEIPVKPQRENRGIVSISLKLITLY
jgi:hypothetical protein